jgi:hypothetical protein
MSENKSIRYGDFLKEVSVNHVHISYNDLAPKEGAKPQQKIKLRSIDIYRLLTPYVSVRFFEQLKAVVPLALYMALLQIFILRQPVADAAIIGVGLVYECGGLDKPAHGMIFESAVSLASEYTLPSE